MPLDSKYMFSPNLQEFFIDPDTNLPLTAGFVNYYKDNDRNTRKPVYQLSGSYDAGYTYTQLPNPVQLGGAGTTVNNAGADIRVYYYPYDENGNIENYYITVTDEFGNVKLSRQAWPNLNSASSSPTNYNYNFVRNPSFYLWNYELTQNINVKTGCTSVNDFIFADWSYMQNDASQNIDILQGTFLISDSDVPGNPIHYLIYKNKNSGSNAATINKFSQTYKSVKTLSEQNVSASCWIKQISGAPANFSVTIIQDFGIGGSTLSETTIFQPILSVGDWVKYSGTIQLPSVAGKTIGLDNKLILNLNMPINLVCEIHITQIRMNEGLNVTDSVEISNDDYLKQTNTINLYPAFTTSDVKPTIKKIADPGWLMMNDQTIGSPNSGATNTGFSFYPLYCVIWNNVNNNTYAPIFTSAGASSTYGANAQSDWQDGKRLSLTKILGRAICSAGTGSGLSPRPLGDFFGTENVTLNGNQNGAHNHTLSGPALINAVQAPTGAGGLKVKLDQDINPIEYDSGLISGSTDVNPPIGETLPHNNMQPSLFLNFMIKL